MSFHPSKGYLTHATSRGGYGRPATLSTRTATIANWLCTTTIGRKQPTHGICLTEYPSAPGNYELRNPHASCLVNRKRIPGNNSTIILRHFVRWEGYEAKIELDRLAEGRKRFRGLLAGVEENDVLLDMEGEEHTTLIPFDWIAEAKLVLKKQLAWPAESFYLFIKVLSVLLHFLLIEITFPTLISAIVKK